MKIFKYLIEPDSEREGIWKATVECDAEAVNHIEAVVQTIDEVTKEGEEND